MTDTIETLKAALADLAARVAAFERARVEKTFEWARVEEKEPPALTHKQYKILLEEYHSDLSGQVNAAELAAARRLRWCERELARLREGLVLRLNDVPLERIQEWLMCEDGSNGYRMACEIQRHRALVKDGGGK